MTFKELAFKEGTNVIIVDNSGNRKVLRVKSKKVKHFKVMLDLGQLIGTEFGMHYLVKDPKNGDIEQITDVKVLTRAFLEDSIEDGGVDEQEEEKVPVKGVRSVI